MEHRSRPRIFLSVFTTLMLVLAMTALISPRPLKKTFALESLNVGVYWDAACRWRIEDIDWEEVQPGSTTQVSVFVRNEEFEKPCVLCLGSSAWSPAAAAEYIALSWDYEGASVGVQEVVRVTLILEVSADIEVVTDFSFNILPFGIECIAGDLNLDGMVDMNDITEWTAAYGSTPVCPNWNPRADLNGNNLVDIYDAALLAKALNNVE